MVSTESRNNIITLGVLAGFAIMISSFIFTFVGNMETATEEVTNEVKTGVTNVTDASATTSHLLINLSSLINTQIVLTNEERELNQKNLATFLGAFRNQTNEMVHAINDMNHDNNVSREAQTKAYVDAINKQMNLTQYSQNLTKYSQNLTETRNQLENTTVQKLDQLLGSLNLTLTPELANSNPNRTN